MIHDDSVMSGTVQCLTYIWYTRRFGSYFRYSVLLHSSGEW